MARIRITAKMSRTTSHACNLADSYLHQIIHHLFGANYSNISILMLIIYIIKKNTLQKSVIITVKLYLVGCLDFAVNWNLTSDSSRAIS